jgi:outer membrane protein OmpA-like peptidoglycan-associated protein
MKNILLIFSLVIGLSSCYLYDGPTRSDEDMVAWGYPEYGNRKNSNGNPFYGSGKSNSNSSDRQTKQIIITQKIPSKDYLRKMSEDIKRAVPSAQVKLLMDTLKVLFPDNIRYGNSAVLPTEDFTIELGKLASLIVKYEQTNVLVTGHTDQTGNEKQNKRLSDLRASYIKDVLIANLAPSDRVNSWGLGSSAPIASEQIPGGKEKNRRVEFIILSTIENDSEL